MEFVEKGYNRWEFPLSHASTVDRAPFRPPAFAGSESSEKTKKKRLRLFTYVPQQADLPTAAFPVYQSYVDVVIAGCLDVSRQ